MACIQPLIAIGCHLCTQYRGKVVMMLLPSIDRMHAVLSSNRVACMYAVQRSANVYGFAKHELHGCSAA